MMTKCASAWCRARVLILGGTMMIASCRPTPSDSGDPAALGPFTTGLISRLAADSASPGCFTPDPSGPAITREYEPHAAANPANPEHMVATWMARSDSGRAILVAASTDGGATWSTPVAVPLSACGGGPAEAKSASDPWVAFGPDGRAYVGAIGLSPDYNALLVTTSVDSGRSWSPVRIAAPNTQPIHFYDNLELTADPTRPGTVYLATTQYQSVEPGRPANFANGKTVAGPAAFARSVDGGQTWTPTIAVTPLLAGGRISAPLVLVAPGTGRLHLVYFRELGDSALIAVTSSEDRGDTWSAERTIAPFVRLTGEPGTTIKFGGRFEITTAQDIIQGAVDPISGRIFVAFSDARHAGGQFLGVSLTSSADGVAWTDPIQVNPPMAAHAWLPSVALDSARRLGVSYLDVRHWTGDTTGAEIPTEHTLGGYRLGPDGLPGSRTDHRLDSFNLLGPPGGRGGTGDYQALLGRRRGFVSVYVKHHPPSPTGITDVMVAR